MDTLGTKPKGITIKGNFFKFQVKAKIWRYKVSVQPDISGELDGIETSELKIEKLNFFGRFFKILQRNMQLKMIGRKYFNPKLSQKFHEIRLEVWPGYVTAVKQFGNQIMLNVDTTYKVLRLDTLLDFLNENRCLGQDALQNLIYNTTVMTGYNKRMYRLERIDFAVTPLSMFETEKKEMISFKLYYEKRYGLQINDNHQPLVVHKNRKTGKEIYLVPQFCYMTGLTEKQRHNYSLMKHISCITKPEAHRRLEQTKKLIKLTQEIPETKKLIDDWGVQVNCEPEEFNSTILNPGNIVLGNQTMRFENSADFERKVQQQMYYQPKLIKWAIVCWKNDSESCKLFCSTMVECTTAYSYPVEMPKIFLISSDSYEKWIEQLNSFDQSVTAVVLILPGNKKAAPMYSDLKKFFIEQKGIPSQVVLSKTLQGKGLRSICNKILVQICAKIGGIPWVVDSLPFNDKPTMLVGMDVYHKTSGKSQKSIFAFVSTTDKNFSKYYSAVKIQQPGEEIGTQIQHCMVEAIKNFIELNKCKPMQVIVFRDGVSESQRTAIQAVEIQAIRQAFLQQPIKLVFICINKQTIAKFYNKGEAIMRQRGSELLGNCVPGTLISERQICNKNDFYLISQKTNQGIATPTHYYVLANDLALGQSETEEEKIMEKFELLSYKLCYMYYNWTGSIKIPAPCQYAHKLSNFVGDRWSHNFNPQAALKKSLFFI